MASDMSAQDGGGHAGFSLTIEAPTDEDTARLFSRLADGGHVGAPLSPSFFSSSFGSVTDRFGISWMVMTRPAEVPAAAN